MQQLEELLFQLNAQQPALREKAEQILIGIEQRGTIPVEHWIAMLEKFDNETVIKQYIIKALTRTENEQAFHALANLYKTEKDLLILLDLLDCFIYLKNPIFEGPIIDKLELKHKKGGLLGKWFTKDDEPAVFSPEELAAELLIPSLRALQNCLTQKGADKIVRYFSHNDSLVRYITMIAFKENAIEIPPKILSFLQNDADKKNREQATIIQERLKQKKV